MVNILCWNTYYSKHYCYHNHDMEYEMKIEYKKENTVETIVKGISALIALGLIVAIPTAVIWGMIYATTRFIGIMFGG